MSASVPDSPSISSSGYNDGLGRREIGFDRETGTLLERLYVRPDIGVFDTAIAGRVDRLQSLVDERFARPIAVERDRGRVVVVSEYVAGVRISDLLENPDALQDAATLDLALGFLLEALPALQTFHDTTGIPHGLLSSGRTVLASSPKVVFLDTAFGDVLGRLHYSRTRMWREFGIALPQSAGPSRATVSSDVGQVALIALMLVLGRPILEKEYLHSLPSLVGEVADVALIRGSEAFAAGLQQFLQTALPIGSQSYATANEALAEIQSVVQREMGEAACTRALTTFIEQIDVGAQPLPAAALAGTPSIDVVDFDEDATESVSVDTGSDEVAVLLNTREETAPDEDITLEIVEASAEIDLSLATPEPEPIDLSFTTPEPERIDLSFAAPEPAPDVFIPTAFDTPSATVEDEPVAPAIPETYEEPRREEPAPALSTKAVEDPWSYRPDREIPAAEEVFAKAPDAPASYDLPPVRAERPIDEPIVVEPPLAAEPAEPAPAFEPAAAPEDEEEAEPAHGSFFSPRRKRGEKSRSARARKDKLRSAAAAFKESVIARVTHQPEPVKPVRDAEPRTPETPRVVEPPPRPKPLAPSMIPASRAASFEPPVPEAAAPPLPRPFSTPIPPVPPPPPVAPVPPMSFEPPSPPMPSFNQPAIPMAPPQAPAPIQFQGAPPISLSKPSFSAPAPASAPALKLKTPVAPPRRERREPPPSEFPDYPKAADPGPRQFPWKLAAAAVVIMLMGVVAGRAYLLPDKKVEEQRAAKEAAEIAAAAKLPPAKRGPGPVPMGKLVVETDTPGARVLLDTVFVGETPLTLEKPAGKYTLTVGAVVRRVVIEAGKTRSENVSLASGFVAIFAPITFEVSEKGRFIGNTEDNRIMLLPGRHELTLTNKALGYSGVHTVDILSTEVVTLNVDPKGRANFNASPGFAEVWLEDKKLGDTPTSAELSLGVHNFVFKHPDFGERKVTATVKHDQPAAVSVDFNK